MKNMLVKLGVTLGVFALMFSFASSASAALTLGALTVTSDGALTVEAAAGSATVYNAAQVAGTIALGGTAGTGAITIGSSSAAQTLNLGTGAGIATVNIGTGVGGNTINVGTNNTTLDAINIGSALDTVIVRGTSAGLSQVELAATRTTGLTGSYQTLAGDLTYEGAAGGTSSYHAGVMGNFMGTALTNANATIHAGVVGKYSVVTSDALVGPKAGLVGEAETSVANSAVMAVLGGDTGTVTPGAAYGVRYLNSTAASKFTYGLDLFSAAVGSYKAVDYGTADIRLQNGETISNATDGTINFGSAILTTTGQATLTGEVNLGAVSTFADTDATPDVTGAAYWNTFTNALTITDFDGAGLSDGDVLVVVSKGAITYDVATSGIICGSTDIITAASDVTTFIYDGTDWRCTARIDTSDDLN